MIKHFSFLPLNYKFPTVHVFPSARYERVIRLKHTNGTSVFKQQVFEFKLKRSSWKFAFGLFQFAYYKTNTKQMLSTRMWVYIVSVFLIEVWSSAAQKNSKVKASQTQIIRELPEQNWTERAQITMFFFFN